MATGLNLGSLAAASQMAIRKTPDSEVDIDLIDVRPQVRRVFKNIEELAESILCHGIMMPLIIHAEDGGRFRLICGERRYRGARRANLKMIPVKIKQGLSEMEIRALQVAENADTETLGAVDEVFGVAQDVAVYGAAEAAKIWNRKPGWVSKRVSFTSFAPEVQQLMADEKCQDLEILGTINQLMKSKSGESHAKSIIAKFIRGETLSRDYMRELVARMKAADKEKEEAAARGGLLDGLEPGPALKARPGSAKRLHKLHVEFSETGKTLAEKFKAEQILYAELNQPMEQVEQSSWDSFQAILGPILKAMPEDRATNYLRRISVEIKAKRADQEPSDDANPAEQGAETTK